MEKYMLQNNNFSFELKQGYGKGVEFWNDVKYYLQVNIKMEKDVAENILILLENQKELIQMGNIIRILIILKLYIKFI